MYETSTVVLLTIVKWMFTDYLFDKRNQTDNKKI